MAGSGSCCGWQAYVLCVPPSSSNCLFSLEMLLQQVYATAEGKADECMQKAPVE